MQSVLKSNVECAERGIQRAGALPMARSAITPGEKAMSSASLGSPESNEGMTATRKTTVYPSRQEMIQQLLQQAESLLIPQQRQTKIQQGKQPLQRHQTPHK